MVSWPIHDEIAISSFLFTFIFQLLYAPSIINKLKHELNSCRADYFGRFMARRVSCAKQPADVPHSKLKGMSATPMTCAV